MNPESFDTIMARNNTTLPQNTAGSDEKDAMRATAAQSGKSHRKNTAVIVAFSVALLLCLLSTAGAAAINKRAAPSASANNPKTAPVKMCHQNTPCGWAIYIPFTRRIDYFMKNTCECDTSLACLKTDDDLSVNAYVYRCKPRPASTTTDIMPTEEDVIHENNNHNNND